jgi:hypothetical protein
VYNKVNSVIRSNQYKKELEQILSRCPEHYIKKELDSLAKKWGLPHIMFFPDTRTVSYSAEDNAVQVISYKGSNDRGYIAEKTKHSKDEEFSFLPVVYVGSGKQKTMYIDRSPSLEEKRYLTLRIDLNEKKGVLMEQFKEKIDSYKEYAKQPKGREGKTKYDPWDIYNMFHENKLNFTQIARKLSGEEGNPTYNPKLEAALKVVKRAYLVAEERIQNVEEEVQNRENA